MSLLLLFRPTEGVFVPDPCLLDADLAGSELLTAAAAAGDTLTAALASTGSLSADPTEC